MKVPPRRAGHRHTLRGNDSRSLGIYAPDTVQALEVLRWFNRILMTPLKAMLSPQPQVTGGQEPGPRSR